jgi:hypothetical protein
MVYLFAIWYIVWHLFVNSVYISVLVCRSMKNLANLVTELQVGNFPQRLRHPSTVYVETFFRPKFRRLKTVFDLSLFCYSSEIKLFVDGELCYLVTSYREKEEKRVCLFCGRARRTALWAGVGTML